jgi:hypothetical protein
VDNILKLNSIKEFQNKIEQYFPSYFDCERAVVVMVQRYKKYLYRIQN